MAIGRAAMAVLVATDLIYGKEDAVAPSHKSATD